MWPGLHEAGGEGFNPAFLGGSKSLKSGKFWELRRAFSSQIKCVENDLNTLNSICSEARDCGSGIIM